jgi:hypothetical protein
VSSRLRPVPCKLGRPVDSHASRLARPLMTHVEGRLVAAVDALKLPIRLERQQAVGVAGGLRQQ